MSEMDDPPRLLDAQANASPALRDLFRRGERDLPSDAALERLAARLGPVLAAPAAPPANTGLNPGLLRGLGIAFGIAAVGVVALSVTGRDPSPSSPRESREIAPPVVSVSPPALQRPAPEPSAEIAPAPRVDEVPSASATVSAAAAPRARAQPNEAALLEQARRALAADPARALALTRQHQQRFPNGVLNQEREVIAIEALRRLGKASEAGDRAGAFEKQFPGSPHQRSVESRGGK